jgi:hypothetical protein
MKFKVAIPRPDRLRGAPSGFGWVDHRLVRLGYTSHLSVEAQALYLFLVTVANESGLSWYSDETLCRQGNLSRRQLDSARRELAACSLVAYSRPVYQVLELPRAPGRREEPAADEPSGEAEGAPRPRRLGQALTLEEIFRRMENGC